MESVSLAFSASTHLSKGYFTTPEQYLSGADQKGYSRSDLSLRYSSESDKYSVGVWLKNVENNAQTTHVFLAYRRFISNPRRR
jgi:iron complex outermembrane recepter protein